MSFGQEGREREEREERERETRAVLPEEGAEVEAIFANEKTLASLPRYFITHTYTHTVYVYIYTFIHMAMYDIVNYVINR
jgi:hypothetical protein